MPRINGELVQGKNRLERTLVAQEKSNPGVLAKRYSGEYKSPEKNDMIGLVQKQSASLKKIDHLISKEKTLLEDTYVGNDECKSRRAKQEEIINKIKELKIKKYYIIEANGDPDILKFLEICIKFKTKSEHSKLIQLIRNYNEFKVSANNGSLRAKMVLDWFKCDIDAIEKRIKNNAVYLFDQKMINSWVFKLVHDS